MFAGKTEEFLRRINKLLFAKKVIQIFKPVIDNRYSKDHIISHNGRKISAIIIKDGEDLLNRVNNDTEIVAIDEIQFFKQEMIPILEFLADSGKTVIVAGLDKDFRGEPFGIMPELLTRAEFITKLDAICLKCNGLATRTQRIIDSNPADYNDPIVLVGAQDNYEARCRHCHIVTSHPKMLFKKGK